MMKSNLAKSKKESEFFNETRVEEEMDHHDKEIVEHNYSWFNNSSLGIFHIDSSIRKACLRLAVDNAHFNEMRLNRKKINARNIHA